MRFFLAFVLLVFSASGIRIQKETDVRVPPNGWIKGARPNLSDQIALIFILNPHNPAILEETLLRVSDPQSPDYGKHLTYEQAHELAAPSIEARSAVRRFLSEFNADLELSAHPYDGMIRTVVSIATAEAMLGCKYYYFTHEHTQTSVLRTVSYSLPAEVANHIGTVGPTLTFPLFPHVRPYRVAAPDADVDPADLRSMYNVGNTVGISPLNQQVATAFLGQYMSSNDLTLFWEKYYTPAEGQNITQVGPQGSNPGIEADLDIEYITSMGGGVPTDFWYFNGTAPDNPANEPFLNMLYYLGNDTTPPWVVSTSYGEDESSVSMSYATSCNQQFQLNGMRGISIIYSSGDSGVGSDTGSCTAFAPQWPAASPYVTSVGATQGNPPAESGVFFSSGGFSNYFPQQPWQTNAINTFFATSTQLPPANRYNATGRGFPDVAAQGVNFLIVYNRQNMAVSGTSCSAPTFSGIFSLLNDLRFQAGKSPLGFLNPWIYQTAVTTPGAFFDVTMGNNPGCGTPGFYAIPGWDPITGVGTPNYAVLSQLVMSMP